jgi:hypothetical protein
MVYSMVDHFKNFQGFCPEGRFVRYYRDTISNTLIHLLEDYRGKEVSIDYLLSFTGEPICEQLRVPESDLELDVSFLSQRYTERVVVSSTNSFSGSYILQKIVIGSQSIIEIDKLD